MSDESFDEERRRAFMDGLDASWNRGLGMTLRDYFAAQALALIPMGKVNEVAAHRELKVSETIAKCCYEIADAMLAERAK